MEIQLKPDVIQFLDTIAAVHQDKNNVKTYSVNGIKYKETEEYGVYEIID